MKNLRSTFRLIYVKLIRYDMLQKSRLEVSQKKLRIPQPEIFQGREGFVKLRHSDKYFIKNSRKKGPAGKNCEVFSL